MRTPFFKYVKIIPLLLVLVSCSSFESANHKDGGFFRPGSQFPSDVRIVSILRNADTSSSEIVGKVVDRDSGEWFTWAGADVCLRGTQLCSRTDRMGHFRILGVPRGVYRVETYSLGCKDAILDSLVIGEHDIVTLTIRLAADSVIVY